MFNNIKYHTITIVTLLTCGLALGAGLEVGSHEAARVQLGPNEDGSVMYWVVSPLHPQYFLKVAGEKGTLYRQVWHGGQGAVGDIVGTTTLAQLEMATEIDLIHGYHIGRDQVVGLSFVARPPIVWSKTSERGALITTSRQVRDAVSRFLTGNPDTTDIRWGTAASCLVSQFTQDQITTYDQEGHIRAALKALVNSERWLYTDGQNLHQDPRLNRVKNLLTEIKNQLPESVLPDAEMFCRVWIPDFIPDYIVINVSRLDSMSEGKQIVFTVYLEQGKVHLQIEHIFTHPRSNSIELTQSQPGA